MVLGLAGAALGGAALSFLGGERANEQNQANSAKQMRFQARMSNTAYQRGMRDMERSGLNPILAYQKGGASSPSGSMPNIKNSLEGAPAAASSYIAAKQATAAIDNTEANTALALEKKNTEQMQQGYINANTDLVNANTAVAVANETKVLTDVKNILIQNDILSANATVAETEAYLAGIDREIYGQPGYKQTRIIEKYGLSGAIKGAGGIAKSGVGMLAKKFPNLAKAIGAAGKTATKRKPPLKIDIPPKKKTFDKNFDVFE